MRTKDGRRSGRWAAVAGLVIGVVATLAMISFVVLAVVMGSRTLWEDEAEVGDCLNVDFLDDRVEASCSEPHDGEVIWVGAFDADLAELYDVVSNEEFCGGLPGLAPAYRSAIESGDFSASLSIDAFDEDDPESGDLFYCYLEPNTGQLEGPIADAGERDTA